MLDSRVRGGLVLVLIFCVSCTPPVTLSPGGLPPTANDPLAAAFRRLSANSRWILHETIELPFEMHHPQGLVKIGDYFLVSAVEILEPPTLLEGTVPGELDRTIGRGIGHVFKIARDGALIAQTVIGEPSAGIYHPGGMAYDGTDVWVPVAEYRPHSRSIVYKLDPQTLLAEATFSVDDHIGDVVYDRQSQVIQGVSWGSREFYTWDLQGRELNRVVNGNHFIDYQDCKFVPERYMLCSGMKEFDHPIFGNMALGGLALVDLSAHLVVHEIPIFLYPRARDPSIVMKRNPMFAELHGGRLRFYFLPEDDHSTIYVYTPTVN